MNKNVDDCPFCSCGTDAIVRDNDWCLAIRDRYPIAEGHTLIIPKAHVLSIFELDPVPLAAVWDLVQEVRRDLSQQYDCHDFNIGVNDGRLAGQTVAHAHVHVIPRRPADVEDPRGGVRWVIPARAAYWD